jgi:hypothetical protein
MRFGLSELTLVASDPTSGDSLATSVAWAADLA